MEVNLVFSSPRKLPRPRDLDGRVVVLDLAFQNHPERFTKGRPKPPALPGPAWINRPESLENEKIA